MRKKIYFRADAGPNIGYGHFIRTLALADMLKDEFECTFFTQSPTAYQEAEVSKVCSLESLPADDTKYDLFLQRLTGEEIVVLDNYFYSSQYQKRIKEKGCRLVCIDDIHDRHFFADLLINHGVEDITLYAAEKYTRYFMGPQWALLRAPFLYASSASERDQDHWVISFGGSDPNNLTLKFVTYLRSLSPNCSISLLLGDGYAYSDTVERLPRLKIYKRQTAEQVAALFNSAGHVLCSASSVCYEALACGCQVHAGYYVDNQVDFYHYIEKAQMVDPLGDLRDDSIRLNLNYHSHAKIDFSAIADRYRMLFESLNYELVDYPSMTPAQSKATWLCRNREEIRCWMTNPQPFSFESHLSFVESLKSHPSKVYYALFDGDEFMGSYDFVGIKEGESAERGLFVNPDCQGRRVATMMEILLDGEIRKRGVKTLLAEVFKNNDRSYRYHLKLGYEVYKEDEKFFYLKRKI